MRRNKGSAGRPKRTICDIRGEYVGCAISDEGAIKCFFAALCMQAVEDIRIWQSKGIIAGRKIVADLSRWNSQHRMTGGEKPNARDILATLDFVGSGRAARLLERVGVPYRLPRVI